MFEVQDHERGTQRRQASLASSQTDQRGSALHGDVVDQAPPSGPRQGLQQIPLLCVVDFDFP
jgi:hypothetical protein